MLKNTILGISFLLELIILAAFSYWGFHYSTTTLIRWIAGISAPLLIVLFWSKRMAPLALNRYTSIRYGVIKLIIFELASACLYVSSQQTLGLTLAFFSPIFIAIETFVVQ
jgi:hypothetical protein